MALKEYYNPPVGQDFKPFLRAVKPPLDTARLRAALLEGDERKDLGTPTTGDASLVVFYHSRKSRHGGAVASVEINGSDLKLVQFQGMGSAGYRLNTGMDVPFLFADQFTRLVRHPETSVDRIVIPPTCLIEGIIGTAESASQKYEMLARMVHRLARTA